MLDEKEIYSQVYSVDDIQKILGGMSKSTASRVMREVKKVSDLLKIKGRIHKIDWEKYLEFKASKNKGGGSYENR